MSAQAEGQMNLQEQLERARARVVETHLAQPGPSVVRQYAEDMDQLLAGNASSILAQKPEFAGMDNRMVLVATGGYGRRELNQYSDVDIMFLFEKEPTPQDEEFVKAFLYPLWSIKIDLGCLVRTIDQAVTEIAADLDSTTALIGAHRIWGRAEIATKMDQKLIAAIRMKHEVTVVQQILERARQRHEKFGNTVLILEPNVKEAPGGLRDIHVLQWVAYVYYSDPTISNLTKNGILTAREEQALKSSHGFLLELRNALHVLEGRKTDVLNFARQIKIAPLMGFTGKDHVLPEEQLMRTYYDHVSTVERLVKRVSSRLSGDGDHGTAQSGKRLRSKRLEGEFFTRDGLIWVEPKEMGAITRERSWMMHLFTLCARHGVRPDEFTLNLVEQYLRTIDDEYREAEGNREDWLYILKHPHTCAATLRAMHQCKFLETYLPEFSLVRNLPRIDYYHQFTVDEHLLRSVDCSSDLFNDASDFSKTHVAAVARDVLRWDLLVFALLFHDVGKGEGRGHVIRGAHLIQRVASRMELSERESEVLYQLVVNHQKMSHMALKRNSEDPKVPEDLARDLGDPELLRMLYVLTCCDLRSVSHDSWNDWRASLLANLFERTYACLRNPFEKPRATGPSHRLMATKVMNEVSQLLEEEGDGSGQQDTGEKIDWDEVEEFLGHMPVRYRQATPPQLAALHVNLAHHLTEDEMVDWEVESVEAGNYAMLHAVARDTPGLFCHLCGALASRGFNILSAQVYTAKNGICVDVFQIQDGDRKPPRDTSSLERLKGKLNQVLKGDKPAKWADQIPRRQFPISSARMDMRPPAVNISNDGSPDALTVLEVKAPDRPGLLYDITSVLDKHRINIHLALVATESYQIVDVFYVTDLDNNRLVPGQATDALRRDLLEVISPHPGSIIDPGGD